VNPGSAAPGQTVAITANVTSATASNVVIDVEVHDPADHTIYHWYWETETFAAGQTKTYQVSWPVLASDEPGTYHVQVGVFTPSWVSELTYNSDAAQVTVTSPAPVVCPNPANRPKVSVTSRPLGNGRLEATIRAQTNASTPTNSLSSVRLTKIDNAAVQLNGSAASVGPAILLPSGAQQATLVVTRQAPGQNPSKATTVTFVVTDACGEWPTFVGGGPGAF
jgi:hypothetical protein